MGSGVSKDSSKVNSPWAVIAVRPSPWWEKRNYLQELRGGFSYFCRRDSFSTMVSEHPWKVEEFPPSTVRQSLRGTRRKAQAKGVS